MTPFEPYPLRLTFGLRHYAFGGRAIAERLGKEGLPDQTVAETWEVSDHDDAPATITNGRYRDQPLRTLVEHYPNELVRPGWHGTRFPLLVKFLDASHELPIHVHPDDARARERYGEPNGKNEAWHVLWAEPDAHVYVGVRAGTTRAELERSCLQHRVKELMHRYPITAGSTVHVPGGVLHTFGPGMLILEVQQTSDLAASVMPEDVYGRPLPCERWTANIHETLDLLTCPAQPRPTAGQPVADGSWRRTIGCVDPAFVLERWAFGGAIRTLPGNGGCATLTNLAAPLDIEYAGGRFTLDQATSCLLPAALGEVEITVKDQRQGDLVVCRLPSEEESSRALS